jgi:DNA-directed RNA polymerase specialized sigma24 family protein
VQKAQKIFNGRNVGFLGDEEDLVAFLDDDDEETDELKPAAPAISPDKRSLVEEHLREGFSVSEIAELTDIPKGEIELIKELSEFSR